MGLKAAPLVHEYECGGVDPLTRTGVTEPFGDGFRDASQGVRPTHVRADPRCEIYAGTAVAFGLAEAGCLRAAGFGLGLAVA
jgi:hypothetical protein